MNIVVENEFARIWSDNATPIVFTVFQKIPEQVEVLDDLRKKQESLIRTTRSKYNEVYSICDFSHCRAEEVARLLTVCSARLGHQIKLGIKFKAFVVPKKSWATWEELLRHHDQTELSCFKTFEEALNTINVLRINRQHHHPGLLKNIRARFFRKSASVPG